MILKGSINKIEKGKLALFYTSIIFLLTSPPLPPLEFCCFASSSSSSAPLCRGSDIHRVALRTSLVHSHGLIPSDHFINRPVATTNTSSALALVYLLRIVIICLGLALCLLLTTKNLTTWTTCHLSSRLKMSTHHVPQHARSHVASALNSHLTKAFYIHYPIQLTLDTGAETSVIKSSLPHSIGAPITKSSLEALKADGLTSFAVVSEPRPILSRVDKELALNGLLTPSLSL